MRYFKNFISFSITLYILSIFLLLNHGYAAEVKTNTSCYTHPAMAEVKQTVDTILQDLESNKQEIKTNPKVVYNIINKLMVPKADFEVMAQLVLTRNWKILNARQKKDFTKEFSRLMIRTYGVAFESYDGETVTYECPVRPLKSLKDRERVEISTTIHSMNRPDNVVKFRIMENDKGCQSWKTNNSVCEGLQKSGDKSEQVITKVQQCQDSIANCKKDCTVCSDTKSQGGLDIIVSQCKDMLKQCKSLETEYKNLKAKKQDTAAVDKKYNQCKDGYNACKNKLELAQEQCQHCSECEQSKQVACSDSSTQWLVYDLIIDNVSIINSYRQIFQDKFKKQKNPDKIIADMHEKNCKDKIFCV